MGAKTYNPLIVEEYRNNNNTWEWHEIFNQEVNKETAGNYSALVDPTATKIRFSSNEEVTHHVTNISLRRRKELTASEIPFMDMEQSFSMPLDLKDSYFCIKKDLSDIFEAEIVDLPASYYDNKEESDEQTSLFD